MLRMMLAVVCLVPLLSGCGKKSAPGDNFLNDKSALATLISFDAQCTKVEGEPKLVPKFAILDADDGGALAAAAQLATKLPRADWARNWKELQTLVLVRSTSRQVGVYKSSQLPALQWTTTVTFIDVPKKQIVHQRSFRGGMPDTKRDLKSSADTASGVKADAEIAPRRQQHCAIQVGDGRFAILPERERAPYARRRPRTGEFKPLTWGGAACAGIRRARATGHQRKHHDRDPPPGEPERCASLHVQPLTPVHAHPHAADTFIGGDPLQGVVTIRALGDAPYVTHVVSPSWL